GGREGTLGSVEPTAEITHPDAMNTLVTQDHAKPPPIAKGLREDFGLVEIPAHTSVFGEREERGLKQASYVKGLLGAVSVLREVLKDDQRLLEVGHRLAVGRTSSRLHACPPKVQKRLL